MNDQDARAKRAKEAAEIFNRLKPSGRLWEAFKDTNDERRTIVAFMYASCDMEEFVHVYCASGIVFEPVDRMLAGTQGKDAMSIMSRDEIVANVIEQMPHALLESLQQWFETNYAEYDPRNITDELERCALLASEFIRKSKMRTLFHLFPESGL